MYGALIGAQAVAFKDSIQENPLYYLPLFLVSVVGLVIMIVWLIKDEY